MLGLLPVFLVKADVGHAEQALQLHPHRLQVARNPDALRKVVLCLLDVALEQVGDGELAMAQRHRLEIVARDRNVERLLKLVGSSVVLTEQPRADSRVVDRHEFVVIVRLLCMLPVVHVA